MLIKRRILHFFNHRSKRCYHKNIIDHYENPRNVGKLDAKKKNVGTGLVGAPACGDVMKLQIKLNNDIIEDVKFKTYGCGSAIASSTMFVDMLKGKTIAEAKEIKDKDIPGFGELFRLISYKKIVKTSWTYSTEP